MPTKNAVRWDILSLYDAVMADVEPDLMRANLPTLAEKYKGETEDQRTARAARYAAAYEEWKSHLQQIVSLWKQEVRGYRDMVLKEAKIESKEAEDAALLDISSTIDSL